MGLQKERMAVGKNPEYLKSRHFIDEYRGVFSQKIEINRQNVENVLEIAHLEGRVFLTSLHVSSQRSIDGINYDGTLTSDFGEKTKVLEEGINPLYRTVPTNNGWKIEINDQRILEELNQKGVKADKLHAEFAKKFNSLLKKGLFQSILKEKVTKIKDKNFVRKAGFSLGNPGVGAFVFRSELAQLDLTGIIGYASTLLAVNTAANILSKHSDILPGRNLDSRWEHMMPQVEVDKIARSWAFLSSKGRKLVKGTK